MLSGINAEVNLGVTLEEGFQDAVHDTLGQKPPLEDSVVGATGADNPLQVIGPANVCHMGRVTDVLLEFGSCLKKKTQRVYRVRDHEAVQQLLETTHLELQDETEGCTGVAFYRIRIL